MELICTFVCFSAAYIHLKAFRWAHLSGILDSDEAHFVAEVSFPQEDVDSIFVPAVG